nr:venom carboxylesterase-6-like [Onthophagus taurus]
MRVLPIINFFVILLQVNLTFQIDDNAPIVKTPLGLISGIYERSYKQKTFSSFYGIPFAQPPIGDLRFEEPVEIKPWPGTWTANQTGIACIQISHAPIPEGGPLLGDEDCLYLNVFVPSKYPDQINNLLDVVVHFHGGAFMFGTGGYYAGPNFLMDKPVILVTLNYRLGYLGFMSTEDDIVPGNMGMKDQVMALKWIKKNIKSFGGNPNSVTITGLSAGGASVHYHYLSKLSKGLFQKGISASGSALAPWTFQENPLEKVRFLANKIGCETTNTKLMVDCLKTRPAKQIVAVTKLLRPWLYNPFSPLGLVVEKAGKNKFLDQHPYVLLSNGKIHDLPWLTSLTSEEGLYPGADYVLKDHYLEDLESKWNEFAPFVLDYFYSIPPERLDQVSQIIKKEYLGDKPISKDTYKELIDMMSDRLFSVYTEKAAKIQAKVSKSPVFMYYFSFMGDTLESLTIHITGKDQSHGTAHGDDMMYLFSIPNKTQKLTKLDENMQEILLNIWMSFIKTGNPKVENVKWPAISKKDDDSLIQLHIKSPQNIILEDVKEINRHKSMWDNLGFEENEYFLSKPKKNEL